MSQIYKLFVLFTVFLGCATTKNNYQYRGFHEYPLSESELASLSTEERAQIPSDDRLRASYFPDAIVYHQYESVDDPDYAEYVRVNGKSHKSPGGETVFENPPSTLHSETKTVSYSSRVIVQVTNYRECIPDTDYCHTAVWIDTTILRDRIIPIPRRELNADSDNMIVRSDGKNVTMLKLTRDKIVQLVVTAKQLRNTYPAEGQCQEIKHEGFTNFLDNPLRARAVDYLTNEEQEYLPYSEANRLDSALTEYEFARNGCFDRDIMKRELTLQKGEEILTAILGPSKTPL